MLQADPDIRGFFGADENTAIGVLKAVQDLGLAGTVAIVGFDSGTAQVEAVRTGLIAGAVMQDPIRMGYKAVEAAISILNGMRVPRKSTPGFTGTTGTTWATRRLPRCFIPEVYVPFTFPHDPRITRVVLRVASSRALSLLLPPWNWLRR